MHYFEMAQFGAEFTLFERFFLTRELGDRVYPLLEERLLALPEGQALVLVFPPRQLVDASFADETIIRLGEKLLGGGFGQRGLLLQGLTEDSQHNIQAVIRLRHLKIAFLLWQHDGSWQILGQLEPSLSETLDLIAQHGRLTAPALADVLHIAVNSASNRLKRLYDLHLVRREYEILNKGLEYTYSFWP